MNVYNLTQLEATSLIHVAENFDWKQIILEAIISGYSEWLVINLQNMRQKTEKKKGGENTLKLEVLFSCDSASRIFFSSGATVKHLLKPICKSFKTKPHGLF